METETNEGERSGSFLLIRRYLVGPREESVLSSQSTFYVPAAPPPQFPRTHKHRLIMNSAFLKEDVLEAFPNIPYSACLFVFFFF